MKRYESRKFEILGKNHVPTCPIFAGPVIYCAVHLLGGIFRLILLQNVLFNLLEIGMWQLCWHIISGIIGMYGNQEL